MNQPSKRRLLAGAAACAIFAALALASGTRAQEKEQRHIEFSISSNEGAKRFIINARSIGGIEGVTLYGTLGKYPKSGRLEYGHFPNSLKRITLVLKLTPEMCGSPVLKRVATGQCDGLLTEFAQKVKEAGRKIILRPFHEFNLGYGDHYWSIYARDADPSDFIPAWRHLVELLRKEAPGLIEFDFNPNRYSFTYQGKRPDGEQMAGIAESYPGDDVVDWVSFSSYNRAGLRPENPNPHTFAEGLLPIYELMSRVAGPTVRFAISETSTTAHNSPGLPPLDKGKWFGDLLESLLTTFPRISLVNFFLIDTRNPGEAPAEWALHGPEEREMFKQLLADYRRRNGMPEPPHF